MSLLQELHRDHVRMVRDLGPTAPAALADFLAKNDGVFLGDILYNPVVYNQFASACGFPVYDPEPEPETDAGALPF